MTEKEIVQALRCRARHEKARNEGCKKCPYWATENLEEWQKLCGWASCKVYQIISDAADAIERLTAENAALREKVALRGKQWRKIASDGTPQEKGYYIAFVERAVGEKPTVRQAYWTGQEWRSCEKRYKITPRVTHWRSMPEGPQEGEKV